MVLEESEEKKRLRSSSSTDWRLIEYLEEQDDVSVSDKFMLRKTSIPNKEKISLGTKKIN